MSLDPYIVIEYIKSSVDIILNLKFEEIEKRLIEKTENPVESKDINTFKKRKDNSIKIGNKDLLQEEPSIAGVDDIAESGRSNFSNT
jgi:hypothetical protein